MTMNPFHAIAALTLVAILGAGTAGAAGPESPVILAQDPEDGAKFAKTPGTISMTFSQPLDASYSKLEVYDACGERVDTGAITVTAFEMTAEIEKRPSGKYKVFYVAGAKPKAATGETFGEFFFHVKKGKPCR